MVANPQNLSLMERLDVLKQSQQALQQSYQYAQEESQIHRKLSMDLRERALSTWVRDFYKKDTAGRNAQKRALNETSTYAASILIDTLVLRERFTTSSTEYRSLETLYGLTMEQYTTIGILSINSINTLFVTNIF